MLIEHIDRCQAGLILETVEKEKKVPALGEFTMMFVCAQKCDIGPKTKVSTLTPNEVVSACAECYEHNGMVM